jgi:hypothetical protein
MRLFNFFSNLSKEKHTSLFITEQYVNEMAWAKISISTMAGQERQVARKKVE